MPTLQNFFLLICVSLSVGILIGTATMRRRIAHRNDNDPRVQKLANTNRRLFGAVKKWVYAVLGVGLVWTVYFLVLGIAQPAQAEYAANVSTLIVSVVTIFSIIIAYAEFIGRGSRDSRGGQDNGGGKDDKDKKD